MSKTVVLAIELDTLACAIAALEMMADFIGPGEQATRMHEAIGDLIRAHTQSLIATSLLGEVPALCRPQA